MKKLSLALLSLLVLNSCEKDADIELPVTPPMMAVFAFVEEGLNMEVTLEEVVPYFENPARDPGPVSGATVIVREGAQTYTFVEDAGTPGSYIHNSFKGEAGKTYHLEVTHPSFPALKAGCTVPAQAPQATSFDYISTPDAMGMSDSVRRIGCRWTDIPGTTNYYRMAMQTFIDGAPTEVWFSTRNASDLGKDGEPMFSGFATVNFWGMGQNINDLTGTFELMTLDEHAAKYHISLDASIYGGDNPFSEPVIMYTNVEGGLGVFGGVNRTYYNFVVY